MKLNKEQAVHCANVFSNYFDKFERIDDYMRDEKLSALSERPFSLPGMGPEEDLFSDFTMSPKDMEFEIVELPSDRWQLYLDMISSHNNLSSPGRNLKLAVIEKKTQKWVGFIRLGSPVINCKPRNEMLGQVFTQNKEWGKRFNHSSMMGFVIVPTQPFGYNYLGGKLLAAICCSHKVREMVNAKYNMNLCLFETTSLYGNSKSVSQYDGMKPLIKYKGLTQSDFLPMMHGKPYLDLVNFVESKIGVFIDPKESSRKLKISNTIVSMTKKALKGTDEGKKFEETITNAKNLTEQKRYYISNYGFKNYLDYVNCKTDILIKDDNYDRFEFENVIEWWRKKAVNRFETLKQENRLRTELEVWTSGKHIDIIR